MSIISAGMEKAGTGWYFNMTNDLIIASGVADIRQVREKYRLHFMLRYYNCNIGRPMLGKLIPLLIPHALTSSFVVKTHSSPPAAWSALAKNGPFTATYIYRDPRDVAISAFDHGRELRQKGETHSFASLQTIEQAIQITGEWLKTWDAWQKAPQTLLVRYEDLLGNPLQEVKRLTHFLNLDLPKERLEQIVASYQKDSAEVSQHEGLHFNKGIVQRYRQVLNTEQLALCEKLFSPYLEKMGYAN